METIKFGKYVELAYEIFVVDNDGEASVFKFTPERPDAFVFGLDQGMIDGFMNQPRLKIYFIEGKSNDC